MIIIPLFFAKTMDCFHKWVNRVLPTQFFSRALDISKNITARSKGVASRILAKVFAKQQRLPKTTWQLFLERVQAPIVLPLFFVCLIVFFVLLNSIFYGYILWGSYGDKVKTWASRCKFAWSLIAKMILTEQHVRRFRLGMAW
jgi:hypothetical protein